MFFWISRRVCLVFCFALCTAPRSNSSGLISISSSSPTSHSSLSSRASGRGISRSGSSRSSSSTIFFLAKMVTSLPSSLKRTTALSMEPNFFLKAASSDSSMVLRTSSSEMPRSWISSLIASDIFDAISLTPS